MDEPESEEPLEMPETPSQYHRRASLSDCIQSIPEAPCHLEGLTRGTLTRAESGATAGYTGGLLYAVTGPLIIPNAIHTFLKTKRNIFPSMKFIYGLKVLWPDRYLSSISWFVPLPALHSCPGDQCIW